MRENAALKSLAKCCSGHAPNSPGRTSFHRSNATRKFWISSEEVDSQRLKVDSKPFGARYSCRCLKRAVLRHSSLFHRDQLDRALLALIPEAQAASAICQLARLTILQMLSLGTRGRTNSLCAGIRDTRRRGCEGLALPSREYP